MYDTKLVTAAQQGDEAAFAALYDRNVDGIYDLCFALVADEEEASRLTSLVFTLAARHLGDISDASQVRPWLLAIARDRVLAEDEAGTLRFGGPLATEGAPSDRDPRTGDASSDPVSASLDPLGTADLRRWVRQAAATLALADQVVVELGTRYDLDPDQLTAAIGCQPHRLESIVAQVEQEAEQVLSALILARQGRRDCKRLAGLLESWDGTPSVDVADVADRHAATCERCRRRRALVNPLELLAAAPATNPPGYLRAQALEQAVPELPNPAAAAHGAAAGARASAAGAAAAAAGGAAALGATAAAAAGAGPGTAPGATPATPGAPTGSGAGAAGLAAGAAAATAAAGASPDATTALPASASPAPRPKAIAASVGTFDRTVMAAPPSSRPWGLMLAVGAAVIVLIAAVVLVLRSSSSNNTKVSVLPPTSTTAVVAPGTTTVTTVAAAPPVTIVPIDSTTITSTLPPVAGSQLTLNTTSVDFGADATSAQVVLSDTGAGQAGWHATSPVPWLTISPPTGFLQATGQVQVTFVIDRHKAPNGAFNITVKFVPSDATGTGASLALVGTNVEPPTTTTEPPTSTTAPGTSTTTAASAPVISNVAASPSSIQTAPCPADQSVVTATVTDPAGLSSVVVDYSLPGGSSGSATMTKSGSVWSAAVGGSAITGSITYDVVATGTDGQSATSGHGTITVRSCSI